MNGPYAKATGSPTEEDVLRAEEAARDLAVQRAMRPRGFARDPWEGPERPRPRPRFFLPSRSIMRGDRAPYDSPSDIEERAQAAIREVKG